MTHWVYLDRQSVYLCEELPVMARTVDTEAHAVRREAFVDTALRLMQAKGYEHMSIQDVLDETGASGGAF